MGEVLNLRSPCVVVLAGPGAAGKSTWAAANFAPGCVVSSDRLRAQVGAGEDDIAATADAFVLLEEIVRRRIARKLTTVIDTLGLEAEQPRRWRRSFAPGRWYATCSQAKGTTQCSPRGPYGWSHDRS